jgi:UDP:flavonoid glycosyltransferase YjiC (YdhE family)
MNINGNGMGHMSTCLAYANRLRGRARPVFFSLASAIEIINDMGFEADYLVSRFWSRASSWDWDQELSQRLGMMFERVRPQAVVFDGTWPYRGLLNAAAAYGVPRLVWSNLILYKKDMHDVPVSEKNFDLVIRLGEIGTQFSVDRESMPGRSVTIPPFTMLKDEDLLSRDAACDKLGLNRDGRYVLFSLGPGNLKDVSSIGRGLVDEVTQRGYTVVWAHAPISATDVSLPDGVIQITQFPLLRIMRAFDICVAAAGYNTITQFPLLRIMRAFDFCVAAAGYNTCCEVIQSRVPTLFVPNTEVNDDQTARAQLVAQAVPAVVSPCETPEQQAEAVARLLAIRTDVITDAPTIDLRGAEHAADESG